MLPGMATPELKTKRVRFRAKQKRRPRRLLESVQQDWDRWDAAASREGLTFTEFARRALDARSMVK